MPHHPVRVWPLEGASNFRDLGGYAGHGGRRLRWGLLFRSDHLGALSPGDQARIAGAGIDRVLDFRGVDERAATPNRLPGAVQYSLAIEPTVAQNMQALADGGVVVTVAHVTALMTDLYLGLVDAQSHRFAELFDHLLQADAPLVFHCTAGKDRTGVAAALVLLALGVPREQVMADYLLTNAVYRHPSDPRSTSIPADALAVLWHVQAGFLEAALRAIDTRHGGMARYLETRMRLSPAALRLLADRYLEAEGAA